MHVKLHLVLGCVAVCKAEIIPTIPGKESYLRRGKQAKPMFLAGLVIPKSNFNDKIMKKLLIQILILSVYISDISAQAIQKLHKVQFTVFAEDSVEIENSG